MRHTGKSITQDMTQGETQSVAPGMAHGTVQGAAQGVCAESDPERGVTDEYTSPNLQTSWHGKQTCETAHPS